MYEELVKKLREEAEWAEGNEWETPIMLSDHLKQAADAIEELQKRVPPVPHGRLIDADKMEESIKMQSSFLKLMGGEIAKIAETLEKGVLQEIDNAPTIIPAEEGEQ